MLTVFSVFVKRDTELRYSIVLSANETFSLVCEVKWMQRVIHQQTLKNPWCWQYNLVLDCIITTPDFLRFYRLMQDCDIFSVPAMKITRSLLYISCHSLTTSLTITCQTWLMHYALACSICQYQRLVRSGIHDDVIKWKHFPRHWRFVRGIHVVCFIEKSNIHDDIIKWKHFPRYWPFVRGIHRSRWIPRTKASDAELSNSNSNSK